MSAEAKGLQLSIEATADLEKGLSVAISQLRAAAAQMQGQFNDVGKSNDKGKKSTDGWLASLKEFRQEQMQQGRQARFLASEIASIIPASEEAKTALEGLAGIALEGAAGGLGFGVALEGVKLIAGLVGDAMKEAEEKAKAMAEANERLAKSLHEILRQQDFATNTAGMTGDQIAARKALADFTKDAKDAKDAGEFEQARRSGDARRWEEAQKALEGYQAAVRKADADAQREREQRGQEAEDKLTQVRLQGLEIRGRADAESLRAHLRLREAAEVEAETRINAILSARNPYEANTAIWRAEEARRTAEVQAIREELYRKLEQLDRDEAALVQSLIARPENKMAELTKSVSFVDDSGKQHITTQGKLQEAQNTPTLVGKDNPITPLVVEEQKRADAVAKINEDADKQKAFLHNEEMRRLREQQALGISVASSLGEAMVGAFTQGKQGVVQFGTAVMQQVIRVIQAKAAEGAATAAAANAWNPIIAAAAGGAIMALVQGYASRIPKREMGGDVLAGRTYRVNEGGGRDEEYFTPSTDGYITPAHAPRGGRGGITLQFVGGINDGEGSYRTFRENFRAIARAMRDEARRMGG